MKAAVCHNFGEPLRIEDVELRRPHEDEVTVRLAACAICHSDIAYAGGAWGGPLPAVYGHEAAGVAEEVASGLSGIAPGDHVVVTMVRSCGRCARCLAGVPTLCEGTFPPGDAVLRSAGGTPLHQSMHTGAFAEYVTVHASQVVRVSSEIGLDVACLLSCGVLTGLGAVLNTAQVRPGATVVVVGAGGVGLNCVQGARLAGAEKIIAVDVVPKKLVVAARFGATHTVNSSEVDPLETVLELTGGRGADDVLVATGSVQAAEGALPLVRRGGVMVLVGIPATGSTMRLDPVAISDGSLRVLGSKMGATRPRLDIPRFARLYLDGQLLLDELVSERFALEQVNDAIASARAGEQLRPVLVY
jgi:S-(hydroxymethyl)glutathione dehydrogenase/alcohol dehydrogenase